MCLNLCVVRAHSCKGNNATYACRNKSIIFRMVRSKLFHVWSLCRRSVPGARWMHRRVQRVVSVRVWGRVRRSSLWAGGQVPAPAVRARRGVHHDGWRPLLVPVPWRPLRPALRADEPVRNRPMSERGAVCQFVGDAVRVSVRRRVSRPAVSVQRRVPQRPVWTRVLSPAAGRTVPLWLRRRVQRGALRPLRAVLERYVPQRRDVYRRRDRGRLRLPLSPRILRPRLRLYGRLQQQSVPYERVYTHGQRQLCVSLYARHLRTLLRRYRPVRWGAVSPQCCLHVWARIQRLHLPVSTRLPGPPMSRLRRLPS